MAGGTTLVGMKCPDCGDHLVPHQDMPGFWYSPSCGGTYAQDNTGNLFKVEISGRVETFVGNTERERHAENAKQFLALREYARADSEFEYLIKNFPEDYRGWLGHYMIPFQKDLDTGEWKAPDPSGLNNALRLNRAETLKHLDRFFERYGEHLRLQNATNTAMNLSFESIQIQTIDAFTKWMLFDGLSTFLALEHQPLTARLYQLSSEYYEQCTEGKLLPYYSNSIPKNLNKPAPIRCGNITAASNELVSLLSSFGCTTKIRKRGKNSNYYDIIIFSPFDSKKEIELNQDHKNHSFTIFGKWLYLENMNRFILLPRALTQSDVWRFGGHCPYCGSAFKGLFTKVCPNPQCTHYGQPKDY